LASFGELYCLCWGNDEGIWNEAQGYMSQEGCGELLEIKTPGGLGSWNPTSREGREKWGTRQLPLSILQLLRRSRAVVSLPAIVADVGRPLGLVRNISRTSSKRSISS
jgi:hypothetical protein